MKLKYAYLEPTRKQNTLSINGERIELEPKIGYIRLERKWRVVYKADAAGPPAAVTIREDTIWQEFGVIEWRVK